MTRRFSIFTAAVALLLVSPPARAQPVPAAIPVAAKNGMVVAQEAQAARIGVEILQKGGNSVDAAVAVGFALAVTYPRAGNIGGGGFMVIHLADGNDQVAIDFRETAPAATTKDIFLDARGEPDPEKSRFSALSVGVPGTVAGLALAHAKYGSGKLSLAELIRPAIKLARDGFIVADDLADSLPRARERLGRWPASAKIFLKDDGAPYAAGDRLVQSDLADTLETIANEGPQAFYRGPTADQIAAAVQAAGGIMTSADLRDYHATVRQPARGRYRDYDIVSMPPPSSGGVHLIEMLNILEGYDLNKLGPSSEPALHLIIESMKRAYADRAVFMGDPNFVQMPVAGLTSKAYASSLRASIGNRATPAQTIRPGDPASFGGGNTTHYSVVDKDGNAVATTTTLNFSYGLGLVAEGTGVLLNNELDDFTAKPGAANAFGLVGYEANLPAPGKRPLSSMTPTIVLKDRKPFLITGSPGGSRIISAVLQVIVNVIDFQMTVAEAVTAPRVHHQWMPDVVAAEPGFAPEILSALEARGHAVSVGPPHTSANTIRASDGQLVGAADTRTRGALAAGY